LEQNNQMQTQTYIKNHLIIIHVHSGFNQYITFFRRFLSHYARQYFSWQTWTTQINNSNSSLDVIEKWQLDELKNSYKCINHLRPQGSMESVIAHLNTVGQCFRWIGQKLDFIQWKLSSFHRLSGVIFNYDFWFNNICHSV
jgi:hypothetical protein